MQIIDTFSGIAGFSLAGRWMGWRTIQFCEINEFCVKVLKYHFPNVPIHNDIKTLTAEQIINNGLYNENEPTIFVGGVPCQPWSVAGKRKGEEDDRNLWPQTIKLIGKLQPDWAVLENVPGLLTWNRGFFFNQVCSDLENEGYEVQPFILPACAVNAPHRRDRVWFVAHSDKRSEGPPRTGERSFGSGGGNNNEPEERGKQAEQYNGHGHVQRTSSNYPDTRAESLQRGENGIHGPEIAPNPNIRGEQEHGLRSGRKVFEGANSGGAPDTSSTGRKEREQVTGREDTEENTAGLDNRPERPCELRDVADTDSRRQSGKEHGQTKPEWAAKNGVPDDWSNFPTQSPVRNGNDGLPFDMVGQRIREDSLGYLSEEEIDNILSQAANGWTKESIMAMGNAIVPKAALQIFKSIQGFITQNQI